VSDEEERRLERLAALGDETAKLKLDAMRGRRDTVDIFMTWDELVDDLGLTEQLIYFDGSEVHAPDWIDDYSWEQARYWLEHRYKGPKLTDEQEMAVGDQFRYAIEKEWLPAKHLKRRIDEIVDPINEVAKDGLQAAGISDREEELPAGLAIEFTVLDNEEDYMEKRGVLFRLYKPFLTAYVEAAYSADGFGDENMGLSDMRGHSIIATAKRINRAYYDRSWFFELREWNESYDVPSEAELEKAIADAAPKPKKRTRPKAKKPAAKKIRRRKP
jgi:hypothetical protein